MIILLHGDDIQKSRNFLQDLKIQYKGKEIRELVGKEVDTNTLTQALESSSLFGGDTVVIIERLLATFNRKGKASDQMVDILIKAEGIDIVLWEDKEVAKSVVASLGPKASVQLFKLPTVLFDFLDSVKPGQAKRAIQLYDQLVGDEPAELVFSMLLRRMRQLLFLATGAPLEGAPWQISRLTTQAKGFTMDKLQSMYTTLGDIEYANKSGATPVDLSTRIHLWLVSL